MSFLHFKGNVGLRGLKGDRGISGEIGLEGLPGEVGYPGAKGDSGKLFYTFYKNKQVCFLSLTQTYWKNQQ